MSVTTEEVDAVRFRLSGRGGHGYEVRAVDDFLDQVRELLAQGLAVAELADAARFPLSRRAGEGYHAQDVDEFLDRLAGHHNPHGHGADGDAADVDGDGAQPSSDFGRIEPLPEEPGFFGRLFRRR
ncbi:MULTISPECIES: DivIVA domain-containing protein [unclassified Luteococcus]|uniref:DivIVA domain-containing protein n=1 Tax=unclassified Luteococcus TaxID=2639923 RepID=UPI00313EEEAF